MLSVTSVAVDRPVLGIGDDDPVGDGLAEGGELALLRDLDRHGRGGVADHDADLVDGRLAGLVGHAQRGVEGAGRVVGVRRVGGRRVGRPVAVEVPRVRERGAVGVDRAGARELHGERRLAVVGRRGRMRDRAPALGHVVDAVDAGVGVVAAEARAPLDHVQRAVRAEVEVHRPQVAGAERERLDVGHGAGAVELEGLDPAVVPLAVEPQVVVERWELGRRAGRVVVVARAAGRGAAAAQVGHVARVLFGVAHPGVGTDRRRQVGQARVVGRVVDRRVAVEERRRT